MNFKTAILGSAAAAFLIASPVLAQDAATAAPQTPAAQEPAAQPSLSLTPGTSVQGPDGELGKLEGVQNNASGAQELTVRGADGQLRAVPLNGIRQEGANVAVAYTKAEFDAAAPIAGATPAPAPAPAAEPAATEPTEPTEPTTTDPADPSGSSDPMAPPTGDQPQG
jgi:pyruvate dehydrogenase E2 component (dihydrolipoamide acetyltransferase)